MYIYTYIYIYIIYTEAARMFNEQKKASAQLSEG